MSSLSSGPRRTLVIMVKTPVAGRVKTRLGRDIGTIPATVFSRHTIAMLAARLYAPRRWTLRLAVAPGPGFRSPALPGPPAARMPQATGDLGQRMQAVFDRYPTGPLILIGSDVLGITPSDIAEAFHCLDGHEAVLGPSPDGGFWLVGLRRRPCRLRPFANVRWSTDEAMAGTLRNLAGHCVGMVAVKADVDDRASWIRNAPLRNRRITGALAGN